METKYYIVARIDGDFAWLKRTDAEEENNIIVLFPYTWYNTKKVLCPRFRM